MTYTNDQLFNCCTDNQAPDWSQFNWLEVGACTTETDETGFEYTNGGEDLADAHFLTIYGHLKGGGCEAITDSPPLPEDPRERFDAYCEFFEMAELMTTLGGLKSRPVGVVGGFLRALDAANNAA